MYNAVKTNTSGVTVIGPSFIQIHNNDHDTMSVGDLSHIAILQPHTVIPIIGRQRWFRKITGIFFSNTVSLQVYLYT